MLLTLMMNLGMFSPTPPTPTPSTDSGGGPGGYTGGTYIGDYDEGDEKYKKFLEEEIKKLRNEDEDFLILITRWLMNNKN